MLDPNFWAALESIFTIAALVVGGVWTYQLFVRQRQRYPRAVLEQRVFHRDLPDGRRMLHVAATLRNVGSVLISVDRMRTTVERVAPLAPDLLGQLLASHNPQDESGRCEIQWYRIGYRRREFEAGSIEIEPGEEDQFRFDFCLKPAVEVVKITSHIENATKRRRREGLLRRGAERTIGWEVATYFDTARGRLPP